MPTEIWTAEDLDNIRNNTDGGGIIVGDYIQMADIDLSGASNISPATGKNIGWKPLGYDYWEAENRWIAWTWFEGSYDGNGYAIYNMQTDLLGEVASSPCGGLFNTIETDGVEREFKNIRIVNAEIKLPAPPSGTQRHVGLLAGYVRSPSVLENIFIQGSIQVVNGDVIGGLVGEIISSPGSTVLIEKCAVKCDITACDDFGVFVGGANSATIQNCYARGDLTVALWDGFTAQTYLNVGGFIGACNNALIITNCYVAGTVDTGTITDSGADSFIAWSNPSITNCYYDSDLCSLGTDTDAKPRLTAQMVYPYTDKHVEGTYVAWEFEEAHITDLTDFDFVFGEPWKHDPDFMLNDGYPQFEPTTAPVDPTLIKLSDCITPSPPIFSVSLNYGNFNSMVIEREEAKITQYRFINPDTDLTLRTKWRYLTPKLEHNVECGFEVRGILIRYKVRGQKPRVRPED